eukprot:TRINITY_DN3125_c0_g1_i2.p1 TRINITY_DN3125_c0_g1~~TRINITY_DN3125_c0_g1_i2.p1  ORF type:complete len:787 (+),score=162.99 TRINITY_DN3125_c0_g1_i2:42-2363(+)
MEPQKAEDPWAVNDPWQSPSRQLQAQQQPQSGNGWESDAKQDNNWQGHSESQAQPQLQAGNGWDSDAKQDHSRQSQSQPQAQPEPQAGNGWGSEAKQDHSWNSGGQEKSWNDQDHSRQSQSQPQAQPEPQAGNGWGSEAKQDHSWNSGGQEKSWNDQGYREQPTKDAARWGDEQKKQENGRDSWNSWDKSGGNGWNSSSQSRSSWGSWGNQGRGSWSDRDAEQQQQQQEQVKKLRQNDFKAAQDWYKEHNIPPGPSKGDAESLFSTQGQGSGEDFALYDHVPYTITGQKSDVIQESLPSMHTFEDIIRVCQKSVPAELEDNIRRCGFMKPTPVQKCAIPVGLAGRDVMCCAQTGSGKTAAFLVPMLACMMQEGRQTGALEVPFDGPCKPHTLIMSPTRELCVQIFEDALKFCYNTKFRVTRVYGQEPPRDQIHDIAKGADVCVATPGRLQDFASAGILNLSEVGCLVIDEADRMLDMGMECVIRSIVEEMAMPSKEDRQTMMFSATFPEEIQKLAQDYLFDHIFVAVGTIGSAASTVSQVVVPVEKDKKFEKLIELIDDWTVHRKPGQRMLVFTNSKAEAKGLDEKLWDKNIANTGALHGDLAQAEREKNLTLFRMGKLDVIVATDVASRGLDIDGVSHVVNYDLPRERSVYVQRIGRTGRIGHRGTSITFIAVDQQNNIVEQHSDDVLKDLPDIMRGAPNTEVPAWLQAKADQLKEGKWGAGGYHSSDKSDARTGWADWNQAQASYDQQQGASASWNAEDSSAQERRRLGCE